MPARQMAVIFIPAATLATPYLAACLAYCAARGYQVYGVIRERYADAIRLRLDGAVDVVVVHRLEHVDPDQEINVQTVVPYDDEHTARIPPERRRPRPIRRD